MVQALAERVQAGEPALHPTAHQASEGAVGPGAHQDVVGELLEDVGGVDLGTEGILGAVPARVAIAHPFSLRGAAPFSGSVELALRAEPERRADPRHQPHPARPSDRQQSDDREHPEPRDQLAGGEAGERGRGRRRTSARRRAATRRGSAAAASSPPPPPPPPPGPGDVVGDGVLEGVGVGVETAQAGIVMTLVSKVTAPLRANALPSKVAPVCMAIEVRAMIVAVEHRGGPEGRGAADLPEHVAGLRAVDEGDGAARRGDQRRAVWKMKTGVGVALGVEREGPGQAERPSRSRRRRTSGSRRRAPSRPWSTGVRPAASMYAVVRSDSAWPATASAECVAPSPSPGGNPVIAAPGLTAEIPGHGGRSGVGHRRAGEHREAGRRAETDRRLRRARGRGSEQDDGRGEGKEDGQGRRGTRQGLRRMAGGSEFSHECCIGTERRFS